MPRSSHEVTDPSAIATYPALAGLRRSAVEGYRRMLELHVHRARRPGIRGRHAGRCPHVDRGADRAGKSRDLVRQAVAPIRAVFNEAIEAGLQLPTRPPASDASCETAPLPCSGLVSQHFKGQAGHLQSQQRPAAPPIRGPATDCPCEHLLADGGSIAQTFRMVGFRSPNPCTAVFRQVVATTPGAYRSALQILAKENAAWASARDGLRLNGG